MLKIARDAAATIQEVLGLDSTGLSLPKLEGMDTGEARPTSTQFKSGASAQSEPLSSVENAAGYSESPTDSVAILGNGLTLRSTVPTGMHEGQDIGQPRETNLVFGNVSPERIAALQAA